MAKHELTLEERMLDFLINDWPHFQRAFGRVEAHVAGLQWLTRGLVVGVLVEVILIMVR